MSKSRHSAVILKLPRATSAKIKNLNVDSIADRVLTIDAARKKIIDEHEAERQATESARRVDEIREEMAFLCGQLAQRLGLSSSWAHAVIDFAVSQGANHD